MKKSTSSKIDQSRVSTTKQTLTTKKGTPHLN